MKNVGKLFVDNVEQKALFELELQGQLSDGHWENASPRSHWEPWCGCEVVVASPGQPTGRTFYVRRDRYALRSKELLDVVGGRMLGMVRLVRGLGWETADLIKNRVDCGENFSVVMETIPEHLLRDPGPSGDYWRKEQAKLEQVGMERIRAALQDPAYGRREMLKDLKSLAEIMKTQVSEVKP